MKQHESPEYPLQKIWLYIAEVEGSNYLIVMDYYSRWLEVISIINKSRETIIKCLKSIFSRFGIPHEVVADNNSCGSQEFKQFAQE